MRRASEEAKKAEATKHFELTPSIVYLLCYNGLQAIGLVIAAGGVIPWPYKNTIKYFVAWF